MGKRSGGEIPCRRTGKRGDIAEFLYAQSEGGGGFGSLPGVKWRRKRVCRKEGCGSLSQALGWDVFVSRRCGERGLIRLSGGGG